MKTYRIKEVNQKFYPQCKNGWKTLWCWKNFANSTFFDYVVTRDVASFDAAIEFITKDKIKDKKKIPKYHKVT